MFCKFLLLGFVQVVCSYEVVERLRAVLREQPEPTVKPGTEEGEATGW